MKINEILQKDRPIFSFEVFPPKRTSAIDTIYSTLEALQGLCPDFISVTYGAGGSDNSKTTLDIASSIKTKYSIESVAHLPCVGLTRTDAAALLEQFRQAGIENILALRGDLPSESVREGDFPHASDLIHFLKEQGDFYILAAGYPEGHIESANIVEDMNHLKTKVEAGADHIITQLFFDNNYFYQFRERCVLMGIDVPIEAGIMPVVNKKQIERMVSLCGATLPAKFTAMMDRYADRPEAMCDAGIAYAVNQIVDLVSQGVDGIHLYTMNNPYIAKKIHEAVHRLLGR